MWYAKVDCSRLNADAKGLKSVARPLRGARVSSTSVPLPHAADPVVSEGRPSVRRGPGLEILGPQ